MSSPLDLPISGDLTPYHAVHLSFETPTLSPTDQKVASQKVARLFSGAAATPLRTPRPSSEISPHTPTFPAAVASTPPRTPRPFSETSPRTPTERIFPTFLEATASTPPRNASNPRTCPRAPVKRDLLKQDPEIIDQKLRQYSLFNQNAVKWQQDPFHNIQFRDLPISTTIQEHFETGQHGVIATIDSDQPNVVPDIPNEQVLVKTFRSDGILFEDGKYRIDDKASNNVLRQYEEMRRYHVPVMTIYNVEKARNGCGYFLVEYVPDPFQVPWSIGAKISELTDDQKSVLEELRTLFRITYDNGIDADLQPDNLRRREDGTLVFVDLRENRPPKAEFIDELKMNFRKMPTFFNCSPGDNIYNYLTQDLQDLFDRGNSPLPRPCLNSFDKEE